MDIKEAIKTALEYEAGVREVYAEAVRRSEDDKSKKIFRVLANEEQGHLDYLFAKQEELKRTGKVTPSDLKTAVPSQEVIDKGLASLKGTVGAKREKARPISADMLSKALKVEEETSAFYRRMVEELPDEGKAFFGRFVEIEEGHVAIVRAELEAIEGTGHWFDFMEFSLEGA